MSLLLQSKIIWLSNFATPHWYPSLEKAIGKQTSFFQKNFETVLVRADEENFNLNFLPLYTSEIMGRADFTLDRSVIVNSLLQKIRESDSHFFLFLKYQEEVISAALFSIRNAGLYFSNRANKKLLPPSLRHSITPAYWAEYSVLKYGESMGTTFVSHGKDTHPFRGKGRIGLPLYKLKVGTKPKLVNPEKSPVETKIIEESFFLSQQEPAVFFTDPNEEGWYKICHLFYPKNSLHESFVNEFHKVTEWAGIQLEVRAF